MRNEKNISFVQQRLIAYKIENIETLRVYFILWSGRCNEREVLMFDYSDDDSLHYRSGVDSFIRAENVKTLLSDEQFDLLMELSSIHSQKVILAMHDHLVKGDLCKVVCEKYAVNAGYLSVCIGRLRRIERSVSKLARFYCRQYQGTQFQLYK